MLPYARLAGIARLPSLGRFAGLAWVVPPLAMILASAGVALAFGIGRGQDINWDQLNYHVSTAILLMRGTFWFSIGPSGVASYLNPVLHLAQFALIEHVPAIVAGIAISLVQGLAFLLAGIICWRLVRREAAPWRVPLAAAGFLLCLMSPVALSELGTTFIDITSVVPILAGYLVLLILRQREQSHTGLCFVAGLLIGAAVAFKLTNAVYVFGLPAFFATGSEAPRRRLAGLALVGLGLGASFLAAGGWWHWMLWQRFGNPVFPFYNALFHAPDFPERNFHDTRFQARSVWDIVLYPFYWWRDSSPIPGQGSPSGEPQIGDARFLLLLAAAALALAAAPLRRGRRVFAGPEGSFLAALVLVYLVWLFQFGYCRYLVGLEILCGAALLTVARAIGPPGLRLGVLAMACFVALWHLDVPDWRHVPWRATWRTLTPDVRPPLLFAGQRGALLFLVAMPSGFIVAGLPENTIAVGVKPFDLSPSGRGTLARQLRAELDAVPPRPLRFAYMNTVPDAAFKLFEGYGLRPGDVCEPLVFGPLYYRVCNLARSPRP